MKLISKLFGLAAAGIIGSGAYASLVERNWFKLNQLTIPLLPSGSRPIKILHISDIHMTPTQQRKQKWLTKLSHTNPDLIINTGDNLASQRAVPFVLSSLNDLLDKPGVYVFGSNDYYAPSFKNPLRYFRKDTTIRPTSNKPELPWSDLQAVFTEHGWHNVTHRVITLNLKGTEVVIGGLDDPHIHKDNFSLLRQQLIDVPSAKQMLKIGLTHSPEPRILDSFAEVGTDLVLAGHTHGGQVCLPWKGALITNCGLSTDKVKGLHDWKNGMKVHISGGIGTSPYAPFRFFSRPEATLITVVGK